MYREKIINLETGEETYRDYTPQEIAEVEKAQEIALVEAQEIAQRQVARKAIFEKLGLSEEEAKLLIS